MFAKKNRLCENYYMNKKLKFKVVVGCLVFLSLTSVASVAYGGGFFDWLQQRNQGSSFYPASVPALPTGYSGLLLNRPSVQAFPSPSGNYRSRPFPSAPLSSYQPPRLPYKPPFSDPTCWGANEVDCNANPNCGWLPGRCGSMRGCSLMNYSDCTATEGCRWSGLFYGSCYDNNSCSLNTPPNCKTRLPSVCTLIGGRCYAKTL